MEPSGCTVPRWFVILSKPKKTVKKPVKIFGLLGAGLVSILLCAGLVLHYQTKTSLQSTSTSLVQQETSPVINRGLPMYLRVPRLGIDAKVSYVGVTQDGSMDAPANIQEVGWYKHGALPGNEGSAVIAGHVNGPKGEPAVFSRLNALQIDEQFVVIDSTQQSTTFVVRTIKTYNQNAQLPEVFDRKDGVFLNLITCSGEWDKTQGRYVERLVVFAEAISR